MSDSKEIVRAAYELSLARDERKTTAASIETFLSLLDPSAAFVADGGARFSGRSEIGRLLEAAADDWHRCSFEVAGVYAEDERVVLAFGEVKAVAAADEAEMRIPFSNLWTLQGGLVIRIEAFVDRSAAIRAAFRLAPWGAWDPSKRLTSTGCDQPKSSDLQKLRAGAGI